MSGIRLTQFCEHRRLAQVVWALWRPYLEKEIARVRAAAEAQAEMAGIELEDWHEDR